MVGTSTGWKPGVPAGDIDNADIDTAKLQARRLQQRFELGDCDIYRSSSDSFHIYFFYDNQRSFKEIVDIMDSAQHVDDEFVQHLRKKGYVRMRVQGKHKEPIRHELTVESEHPGTGSKMEGDSLKRTLNHLI